jgi:hypothetical protein
VFAFSGSGGGALAVNDAEAAEAAGGALVVPVSAGGADVEPAVSPVLGASGVPGSAPEAAVAGAFVESAMNSAARVPAA